MDVYEQLWSQARQAFEGGQPQLDPILPDKLNDRRRGVTLAFRPSPQVRETINDFFDRLAREFPGHYIYQPEELHVTVMSIITMSDKWEAEMPFMDRFHSILDGTLARRRAFGMEFRGVTASPSAVMIQGFPVGDGLASIRDELRAAFARNGFPGQLDRRYKITAAHLTGMRFCHPNTDWKALSAWLEQHRQTPFGRMEVEQVQLLWGDWYASAASIQVLRAYPLASRTLCKTHEKGDGGCNIGL